MQVEKALYGSDTTSGAIYRLLQRCSLSATPLSLNKKSISEGIVTEAEFGAILNEFQDTLSLEARGRVRKVTLIQLNNAVTMAKALGRGDKSIGFLNALQTPLPRLWELEEERETVECSDAAKATHVQALTPRTGLDNSDNTSRQAFRLLTNVLTSRA